MDKLDKFDYEEPKCPLSGGKSFYYPEQAPKQTIPVSRIISKLDEHYSKNDGDSAKRLLDYWYNEATAFSDLSGKLSIVNEYIGYYRKVMDKENSEKVTQEATELLATLNLNDTLSGATILLNIATNKKAFDHPQEAVDIYQKVLSIYNRELKQDDTRFAGLYNNFALSLADLGKIDESIEYFNKAIELSKSDKKEYVNTAISYINLAETLYSQNPLDERIDNILQQALDVIESEQNKNGYYAFVISKCAPSFRHFGWFMVADELENLARSIYERS